jgi:predicted outer membrane repeat protein
LLLLLGPTSLLNNNKAALGGAVKVGTGTGTPSIEFLSQVSFSNNVATTSGGAISIASSGIVTMTKHAVFTGNTAQKVLLYLYV